VGIIATCWRLSKNLPFFISKSDTLSNLIEVIFAVVVVAIYVGVGVGVDVFVGVIVAIVTIL
jgi:hypothetical protein